MPLIEFRCPLQHITERILTFAQAEKTNHIGCGHVRRGHKCGFVARRVEISRTGKPILKGGGAGGFYAPST